MSVAGKGLGLTNCTESYRLLRLVLHFVNVDDFRKHRSGVVNDLEVQHVCVSARAASFVSLEQKLTLMTAFNPNILSCSYVLPVKTRVGACRSCLPLVNVETSKCNLEISSLPNRHTG